MKKMIIKASAYVAVSVFVIAACALDSESVALPLLIMGITGGYIALLAKANRWFV